MENELNGNGEKYTPKKGRKGGDWGPRFIAALRGGGNVRRACEAAKICRRTAYNRRGKDSEFAEEWDEAVEDACDELVEVARDRAKETSDTLLIFLLKAHRPDVYREKFDHNHKGSFRVEHGVDLEQLSDDELKFFHLVNQRVAGLLEYEPGDGETPS